MFSQLQKLIISQRHPFFIGYLRAHSDLPGPLSDGNAQADSVTWLLTLLPLIGSVECATGARALHHLNSRTLRLLLKISRNQARQIVKQCPLCVTSLPILHLGVNPRGLVPNELWQMDVTHLNEFGKLKHIHVTVDTFSGFIYASLQAGEASRNVIVHILQCLSLSGKPTIIKTDNGPGYVGKNFQQFCSLLQIKDVTGIPYNPQGQGIVEHAHQILKNTLTKLKKGDLGPGTMAQ